MRDFVEECRREWKRLRVPDPVANEMAADLAADLEEAEAEGASAEKVLGSGAFDPRSFAASWAAERGVIQPPPVRDRFLRRSIIPAATAALAVIAAIGAALAILASPSRSAPAILASRPGRLPLTVTPQDLHANVSAVDLHPIGWILLIVGIVGILSILIWSSWAGRGHWSRRPAYIDEGPGDPGHY